MRKVYTIQFPTIIKCTFTDSDWSNILNTSQRITTIKSIISNIFHILAAMHNSKVITAIE